MPHRPQIAKDRPTCRVTEGRWSEPRRVNRARRPPESERAIARRQENLTMAKSPEEMEAAMVANLAEKTGKTLEQWLKITKASKPARHGEIVKLLKSEHGVSHGFANLIAHRTLQAGQPDASDADLVEAQYAGDKAALRPIYESLVAAVRKFGTDVELSPKKAYVSVRRSKQFALFQPSTKARLDVGLNLKGVAASGRLEASGSFSAMCTHRVRVEDPSGVNPELIGWLKEAYDRA